MAGQNAIKMGGGYVTLFTDQSPMVRGLKSARKEFDDWAAGIAKAGAGLAAVGGAGLAGGMAAVKQFADAGGKLDDISQRTGASVEALSKLGFAAQMGGSSLEAVEGGSKKLQKALGDAIGGNKEAAASFTRLGLSASDVASMPLDQQMSVIGDAITNIEDPVQRANAAMDIFGKSGTDLIPMFNGLSDAVKRADQLGLTWTGEDAERAAALGDRLDELADVAVRTVEIIGGALEPAVMALSEPLLEAAVATKEFIAENPGLVEGAAAAAAAIGGVGVVLVTTATGITAVSMSFGVLAGVLASPIVLAPALAGLGYLVTTQTDVGIKSVKTLRDTFPGLSGAVDTAANSVGESFDLIATDVIDASGQAVGAWQGIVAAVSAGDLELAGEIAMAGLEAVWLASTASIRDGWDTATAAVLSTWTDISASMQSVGEDLTAWFSTMWLDIKGFAFDAFDAINSKWDSTSGSIADMLIDIGVNAGVIKGNAEEIKAVRREDAARRQSGRDAGINARGQDRAKQQAEIEANRQAGQRSIETKRQQDQQQISDERDAAIIANEAKTADAKKRLAKLKAKAEAEAAAKAGKKPDDKKKKPGAIEPTGGGKASDKPELQVSGLASSLTRGGESQSPEERKSKEIQKTTEAVREQSVAYELLAAAARSAAEVASKAAKDAGKTAEQQKKAAEDAAAEMRGNPLPDEQPQMTPAERKEQADFIKMWERQYQSGGPGVAEQATKPSGVSFGQQPWSSQYGSNVQLPIPDLSGVRLPDITSAERISSSPPVEVHIDTSAQNTLLGDIVAAVRSLESRVANAGGLTA